MRLLFLLFFHLLFFSVVIGQPQYNFKRYSTEDGISHNLIEDILQDSYGFIWLATSNGVTKFDGYEFKNYYPDEQNASAIAGRKTYSLMLDKQDRLWVGGVGFLQYYNPIAQKFSENFINKISETNGVEISVMDIAFDENNNPWIGTGYGLFYLELDSSKNSHFIPDTSENCILDSRIFSLFFDQQGQLWIGGEIGVSVYDRSENQFRSITMKTPGEGESIVGNYIRDIVMDEKGNIWLAASGEFSGISKFDNSTKKFTNFKHEEGNANSIIDFGVISLSFDEHGKLWAATDGGIEIIDLDKNTFTHINHEPSKPNSLSLDIVMKIFRDRDNRMWIGTFGGLNLWDKYSKPFYSISTGPDFKANLPYGNIMCLEQSEKGGFWIGMDGGGISYYDPSLDSFKHFQSNNKMPNSLSSNKVLTMFEEGSRGLWIGFWNENIDFYNYQDEKFYNYNIDPINNSISDGNVFDIFIDSKNRVWIATWDGLNQMIKNGSEIHFKSYRHNDGDSTSLVFNRTRCIEEDTVTGRLFIGTERGLSIFNVREKTFINYFHDPDNPNSLYSNEVNTIYRDSQNNFLIGTTSGLNTYHTATSELKRMIINDEFIDINVQGIQETEQGNIWISSKRGIHKLSRGGEGWSMNTFTKKDGLGGNDFLSGSTMKLDNELYFGGMNGITYFNPAEIKPNEILPDIFFENIEMYEEVSSEGEFMATQVTSLLDKECIRIIPEYSMFTINFLGLTYTNSEENRYKYKLSGFQEYWRDISHERKVTFTNLEPGEYTFELMVANSDEVWNPEPKQLVIIILPPWYKTLLARIIFGILVLLSVYFIAHFKTINLKKSRERLKSEVAKRTYEIELKSKELDEANLQLDQQLKEIEVQNEEITAQLESLLEKSEQIELQNIEINKKNEQLKNANEEREKANKRLRNLNTNMEKIIEEQTRNISLALDKLQKKDQELNTLLYRSSHDLKGPLTTLAGLSVLAKYEKDENERLKFFDLVGETSNIMIRNLKKLQDVHLIFNKKPYIQTLDLAKAKEDLIRFLEEKDKSGFINKDIIIENPDQLIVKTDQELLKIALENISENAVYFSNSKRAFMKILFDVSPADLKITVEDNGLGLIEEKDDMIFNMFYRGKENSKGAGLGLYTARMAIKKLKGEISYFTENKITKFVVQIPLQL